MTAGPTVQITAFTHQGLVRDCNEDTIAIGQWARNVPMSTPHQWRHAFEAPVICVVADGMGGQAAGEIASQHVATRLSQEVVHIANPEKLGAFLQTINSELYDLMSRDASHIGMGTTVVGVVLNRDHLIWFNIGDSRLYRHRNGFLRQISIDDVPDAVKSERLSSRRQSHAITQSLGGTKTIQRLNPHVAMEDLAVPSRWLLCSDGITDMVDIDAMEACMAASDLEAVSKLVELAMQAGGEDNISIIILSVAPDIGLVPYQAPRSDVPVGSR
jgi:serine/threonine protein phosphatase PrpC